MQIVNFLLWSTGLVVWIFGGVLGLSWLWGWRSEELSVAARDRILEMLASAEMSGRVIQDRLVSEGLMSERSRGAMFYSAMADMEKARFVRHYDVPMKIGEVSTSDRLYRRRWS